MKRISMLLALSVAALTGTLSAQMEREITVHLQHPVMVKETSLPAGDYSLQIQNSSGAHLPVLIMQSRQASVMALVTRSSAAASEASGARVLLKLKDGIYRLDKVVVENTTFELQ